MIEFFIGLYFLENLICGMTFKAAKVFVPFTGLYPGQMPKDVEWYIVFPGIKTGPISLLLGIFQVGHQFFTMPFAPHKDNTGGKTGILTQKCLEIFRGKLVSISFLP